MKKNTLVSLSSIFVCSALISACGDDSSSSSGEEVVNNYNKLPSCNSENDAQVATLDTTNDVYVCRDGKWETLDIEFVASDTAATLEDIPNCATKQEGNSYFIEKVDVAYICKDGRWEIASKEVTGNTEEKDVTEKSSASKKDDDTKVKSSSSEKASEKKSSASNTKTNGDSDKSSSANAKSSSATAKSSSSAATKNSSSSKTAKSSTSTKSSSSTAKSSAATAKSSSSSATAKSSAGDAESSAAVATSSSSSAGVINSSAETVESSSSETEKIAATLDDAPNCEESTEGEIYFIEDKDAYYICTSERRWLEQESCGKKVYSSDTAFCHNETIYSLCNGSSFDPATQKCESDTLKTKCGENYYTASKLKKCEDGVAYGLCSYMRNHKRATNPYILDQQRCNSGIFDDCNGQSYNIENYTCEDGELIAICGGEKYDAAKQFCVSDKLRDLCGGEEYELSSQFCNEGTILDKCGNSRYDPSTQFCHSGTLYTKCSGDEYNPATQSCVQDTIHATCGTTDYNTKKQMCDSRDNRLYKITTIGSQTWMAENLNTTEITYSQYSYCYDDKEENCDKYGRLYYWSTAVDKEIHQCGYEKDCNLPDGNIQGICPEGWHLPSRDEWETLLDVVQCSDWETDQYNNKSCVGSSVLKSEEWDNSSDNYDFSVIAAGLRDNSWTFRYKDEKAHFWASTEYNENWGVAISITNFNNKVGIDHMVKDEALSIRCIKDDD